MALNASPAWPTASAALTPHPAPTVLLVTSTTALPNNVLLTVLMVSSMLVSTANHVLLDVPAATLSPSAPPALLDTACSLVHAELFVLTAPTLSMVNATHVTQNARLAPVRLYATAVLLLMYYSPTDVCPTVSLAPSTLMAAAEPVTWLHV